MDDLTTNFSPVLLFTLRYRWSHFQILNPQATKAKDRVYSSSPADFESWNFDGSQGNKFRKYTTWDSQQNWGLHEACLSARSVETNTLCYWLDRTWLPISPCTFGFIIYTPHHYKTLFPLGHMESVGIVGIVCEEQSKNLKIEPLCLALLSVFR